jgi:glycosyltransferase involved in cell wall biosynthesis
MPNKIAFVDWSNYPYGGDTTYISNFLSLAKEKGTEMDVYFFERSHHPRNFEKKKNLQSGAEFLHFAKRDMEELFKRLDTYDSVCFVQTPHEKVFTRQNRERILEWFRTAKPTVGLQAHIFAKVPLAASCMLLEYAAAADYLITREDDPNLITTTMAKKMNKTLIPLTLYSDLTQSTKQKEKKMLYRGRYDRHKLPEHLPELAKLLLPSNPGMTFKMMGIDESFSAYNMIHIQDWAKTYRFPDREGGFVEVSPPFSHKEGVSEMEESLFAFCPRTKLSGSYLEYSQIEAIQAGSILILSKEEGTNSYLPDGTRWVDIPHFAVWLDPKDYEGTVSEILNILNSPSLQEKYRQTPKNVMEPILSEDKFEKHLQMIFETKKHRHSVESFLAEMEWPSSEIKLYTVLSSKYMICPIQSVIESHKVHLYQSRRRVPVHHLELLSDPTRTPRS